MLKNDIVFLAEKSAAPQRETELETTKKRSFFERIFETESENDPIISVAADSGNNKYVR